MEARPGLVLAARLKATLDEMNPADLKTTAQEADSASRRARIALLENLAAFAAAVGHLRVRATSRGLHLHYLGRGLMFEPIGDADVVRVRGTSLMTGVHRLILQPGTGVWMLGTFDRSKRERYRPLFDEGLAELMQRALHLPEPPPEAPAKPPRNWVLAPDRPPA